MKALFCLLAFFFLSPAYGQDYCKNIIKEVTPDKKMFDFASPADAEEVTIIKVARSINVDPDYESDNFFMVFQVVGDLETIYTKNEKDEQVEKTETKLVIELDDKSTIVADTISISHDVTSDKMQAIRIAYFPVTDAVLKTLTSSKITKFSLAGHEKSVTPEYANAIMHYVDCIKKAK